MLMVVVVAVALLYHLSKCRLTGLPNSALVKVWSRQPSEFVSCSCTSLQWKSARLCRAKVDGSFARGGLAQKASIGPEGRFWGYASSGWSWFGLISPELYGLCFFFSESIPYERS